MPKFNISFDTNDKISEQVGNNLISNLKKKGAKTKSTKTKIHESGGTSSPEEVFDPTIIFSLITVLTASLPVLAVVVAFMYKTFRSGIILDLSTKTPEVRKDKNLPYGSVLIKYSGDKPSEFRENLSSDKITELMLAALNGKEIPEEEGKTDAEPDETEEEN